MLSHLRSLLLFHQEIMLPWYTDFANQYLAQPYGSEWKGNFTLLHTYEKAAYVLSRASQEHKVSLSTR